jgi:photosystem II stability/assembly factor-like uncharacterized protein
VYRSDDGGVTFNQKSRAAEGGDLTQVTPREVLVDPFDPATLYIAADSFGLLRSRDAGEQWEQVATPTAVVTSVAVHLRNPNILTIAGAAQDTPDRSKIWKTFDRGETWQEIYAEAIGGRTVEGGIFRLRRTTRTAVMTLGVDPRSPEVLYAGSSSGALIASTDGGSTWSTRRSFAGGITGLKISPGISGRIFVRLVDGALGRSDDGGRTAKRLTVQKGTTVASTVYALLRPPKEQGTVLAGTDRGLFRSRDAGETWDIVPLPVSENQRVQISTVAQGLDGVLWAGSNFNIYSSKDGGSTWRVQQFAFANPIRFILTDPVNPQRVYAFFLPATV